MIEPDYTEKSADFDATGLYRYGLVRRWAPGPIVLWIMINPSTANAVKLDPTLLRCLGFTMRWEPSLDAGWPAYGAFEVANLYAFRSSNPDDLWKQHDPIGPENDAKILAAVKRATLVICGWGNDAQPDRERQIAQMLADNGVQPYCLALCKNGSPSHPLARGKARIPDTATPVPWHAKGLR